MFTLTALDSATVERNGLKYSKVGLKAVGATGLLGRE